MAVLMMEAVAGRMTVVAEAVWMAAVAVQPLHLQTPASDYCGQPRLHSQCWLLLC